MEYQFEKVHQTGEKIYFIQAVELYEAYHGCKPMSEEEYQIIVDRA